MADSWKTQVKAHRYDEARAECERLLGVLMRYRYAVAFAAADAWDGGSDIRQRFEWARSLDENGQLSNDEIAGIGADFLAQSGTR